MAMSGAEQADLLQGCFETQLQAAQGLLSPESEQQSPKQQQQQQHNGGGGESDMTTNNSHNSNNNNTWIEGPGANAFSLDGFPPELYDPIEQQQQMGGSGDGDMLPSQAEEILNRRKAQNRAAQKSFRDRKQKRFKELEDKLQEMSNANTGLEETNHLLVQELEMLRMEFHRLQTEKMDLEHGHIPPPTAATLQHHQGKTSIEYGDFFQQLIHPTLNRKLGPPDHSKTSKLLTPNKVWDYIKQSPHADSLDISLILSSIEGKAMCDGYGPIYAIEDVDEAIRLAQEQ